MSWFSDWLTTNGLSKSENLRSALTGGISNFVGPDRKALTLKNASDPLFRGIASKNPNERLAGGLTAAIFGAYGLGALGGGAGGGAGEADAGATDLGGFGGMLGGSGGFTSEVAPDITEGFGGGAAASESPWWQQLAQQGSSGGSDSGNSNSYDNYQRMKVARALHALKMQQNQYG